MGIVRGRTMISRARHGVTWEKHIYANPELDERYHIGFDFH